MAGAATRARRWDRHLPLSWPRVQLAGITADLFETDDAVGLITAQARGATEGVLAIVSANLDHLHHFGSGRTSARLQRRKIIDLSLDGDVRWLTLLDGAPLVHRAGELTGRPWPRLAGSDLIEPLLTEAESLDLSVGFLGGASETHDELRLVLERRWPRLSLGGCWSPSRVQLNDPEALDALSAAIRATGVDILVVCLGKPRQEAWIAQYSGASGVKVCLAFGAVVDFLAGRVDRAPRWVADHSLEWAWRLSREPKRLARRYLVQGPPAYLALKRDSFVTLPTTYFAEPATNPHPTTPVDQPEGRFTSPDDPCEIAVLVVTHNNVDDVDVLVASVRRQLSDQSIRMIVADNDSTDGTLARLAAQDDVIAVPTGGNLGYAGGINVARRMVGDADAVLVLNPDLELAPGALRMLRARLNYPRVGVAVPRLLDTNGEVYASLRREPSLRRSIGDALFGERFASRPGSFSELELDRRQYRRPHAVDWATGAALLVSADVERAVGLWDERFFLYSEEIDYLRRVRALGYEVWFEPGATAQHRRGGSGSSDQLEALMAVNRLRYAEKWWGAPRAQAQRAVVMLGSVLRLKQSRHRLALTYLARRDRWANLPAARLSEDGGSDG